MLRKIFILAIFLNGLFFSISISASPYDRGMLWEIEAPNGAKNYLFGTMHLVCEEADLAFNLISNYVQQSRIVFIEYDHGLNEESFISRNIINTAIPLKDRFSPLEVKKLKALMRKNHITFASLEYAAPFLVYFYLTNPGSFKLPQMDFKISDLAKKNHIPLKGLENTQSVLQRIISFDNAFYVPLLKKSIQNPDYFNRHAIKSKALYLSQDLNGIIAFLNEDNIPADINKSFLNSLLYERNLIMFENARSEINKGKVFMAVGAAHLAGEHGLLQLFHQAGYKITRLDIGFSKLKAL